MQRSFDISSACCPIFPSALVKLGPTFSCFNWSLVISKGGFCFSNMIKGLKGSQSLLRTLTLLSPLCLNQVLFQPFPRGNPIGTLSRICFLRLLLLYRLLLIQFAGVHHNQFQWACNTTSCIPQLITLTLNLTGKDFNHTMGYLNT